MPPYDLNPTLGAPEFSIIIAVYNDWKLLADCLRSLSEQTNSPRIEVIIVDDGSHTPAPESIREWSRKFPLTVIREPHNGIPASRNRGIQNSAGSVLVFTDADCRLQPSCLSALASAIASDPDHSCFQLHLTGDSSGLTARAEELRLREIQSQTLQANGTIRYLNTAGFAIRRSKAVSQSELFHPAALRGEDTLLLVDFMQRGELPFFVADAIVRHVVSMSLVQCLRKDVRSAWLETKTFEMIEARGVQVRMSYYKRITMLISMWKTASRDSIGRAAWLVLVTRQSVQRIITVTHQCLRVVSNLRPVGHRQGN
jgi:glycosyltransferase involved in cell wall biosynthesis